MAGVARVILNNRTLVDVTQDTVEENKLMAGNTALGADGDVVQGGAREDHENELIEGKLNGVYINPTITVIGNHGLRRADNNQSDTLYLSLPNVSVISQYAVYANTHLTSVYMPKATVIGSSAFRNCYALTTASFEKVVTVHISAFHTCSALTTISMPEATVIGSSAFQSCPNLVSAYLPKVSKIHDNSFVGCTNLSSLTLPYVCSPGATTFNGCKQLKDWVHNSTGIYTTCFNNCTNLSAVDVGNQFNATRQSMFNGCTKLSTFVIRKGSVVALSHINCFGGTPFSAGGTGGTLYVPSAVVSNYQTATNWVTILGYANNQVLPIEGSLYESMYTNGDPVNANTYLVASSGDYIELTVKYSTTWKVQIDGLLNNGTGSTTYEYYFTWGEQKYGGGWKSSNQGFWFVRNNYSGPLLTSREGAVAKQVIFDYSTLRLTATYTDDIVDTNTGGSFDSGPGDVYGRLCFTSKGEHFNRIQFFDQSGVCQYNYIATKDNNDVACMYETINGTYSYSANGTASLVTV